jgi:hypothetical protein
MAVGGGYGKPAPGYGRYGQAGYGQPWPRYQVAYDRGQMRASDADREWTVEYLKGAFTEGRLDTEEYDARVGHALAARTHADLEAILADLRVAPAMAPAIPRQTNSLAIASLICGLGQLLLYPLATIPAIVLGHVARRQIQRTGEAGSGMALAGLLLGWAGLAIGLVVLAGILLFLVTVTHGTISVQPH